MVHEDAAHDASGQREEMCAVVPRDVLRVDQPEIRLVDERRRLETVSRTLSCHTAPRDPVELPMDERNQSLEGTLVALPPFEKQPGDLRGVVGNAAILGPFDPLKFSRPFAASQIGPYPRRLDRSTEKTLKRLSIVVSLAILLSASDGAGAFGHTFVYTDTKVCNGFRAAGVAPGIVQT